MSKEKTNIEKNDKGDADTFRVRRGGCWDSSAGYTRVSYRYWDFASYRNRLLGFRLVLQTKKKK